MQSKITVASNALVLLGASPIMSFSEGITESEVANLLFDSVYSALLSETKWHFATRYHRMSQRIESENPNYKYKFALPPDVMYVIEGSSDYEIFAKHIYTDQEDMKILYVYEPDIDQLPPYFILALTYKLASVFAVPVTADVQKTKLYEELFQMQMRKARFSDSSSRTMTFTNDSPYTEVR